MRKINAGFTEDLTLIIAQFDPLDHAYIDTNFGPKPTLHLFINIARH
jgi:hypothetical protein